MGMHNPPHPGRALREFRGDLTVTEAQAEKKPRPATVSFREPAHA